MKIGYLSTHNPRDRNAFSGTSYYMYHALVENPKCSVRILGSHRPPLPFFDKILRSASATEGLGPASFRDLDVVLSLVSTDLVLKFAAYTDVPFIHCTDATPGFLKEFYGYDVPDISVANEARAYDRAALVHISSEFMLERALAEFGSRYRSKLVSLPWGANLDRTPKFPPRKPPLRPLRLLFMGREWARKGGSIAVETVRVLNRRGVAAELHVVGATPTGADADKNVISYGLLNKNRRKERMVLEGLLDKSHFLVLPTRADCTPMSIAEANSHGLPALVTDVGGIPSLVKAGQNGEMLPVEATADVYADRLMALSENPERYEALSVESYRYFREHLSWVAWSNTMIDILTTRFKNVELGS